MDGEFLRILDLTFRANERLFFFHPETKQGFMILPLPQYEALLSQQLSTDLPAREPSTVQAKKRSYSEADFDLQHEEVEPPIQAPKTLVKQRQTDTITPPKISTLSPSLEERFYFEANEAI